MNLFEKNVENPSVSVAKERLKNLLIADRVECKPDTYELMCKELYRTVSKYMKVDEDVFEVEVTRSSISIKLTGEK